MFPIGNSPFSLFRLVYFVCFQLRYFINSGILSTVDSDIHLEPTAVLSFAQGDCVINNLTAVILFPPIDL